MASERFVDALNDQIAREFAAAHQYTAIGAHYDRLTYPRLSSFFYEQAEEERDHALRMVNYLRDLGAELRLSEVGAANLTFEDEVVAPIRLALEQERRVTVQIHKLFQIARETDDYASESFIRWFIDEQVEEESSIEGLLTVAERVREVPMMLEEFLARDADQLGGADASA